MQSITLYSNSATSLIDAINTKYTQYHIEKIFYRRSYLFFVTYYATLKLVVSQPPRIEFKIGPVKNRLE